MGKVIFILFILIFITACDPMNTANFTISNYTDDTLKVAGNFMNNDTILENDSIIKIIPNSKIEITRISKFGNSILIDSVYFLNRITMKNDLIYCKKNWQNISTWTKSKKGKWLNEYDLTLNNTDF